MKSLTAATLATIMSLGAAMSLYEEPTALVVDDGVLTTDPSDATDGLDFAQVKYVDHPALYDVREESEEMREALRNLDDTWEDAEAQIKWW